MIVDAKVLAARARSFNRSPLDGWIWFVEDHDEGDADPGERVLATFVLVVPRVVTDRELNPANALDASGKL